MKTFNLIFTLLFLFVSFSNADVLGTKTQGPALIEGFNEIASAAGTTTLTKDSQTKQILTGTSTQTFVLPDATTIPLSRRFLIINKSTGTATIQTSGGGALTIISAGLQKEFHLRAAGSAAGTWDVLDGGGGGGAWGGITGTLSDQTDLQTALNAKAPTASPTFTGTIGTPLTASRALVTDASGNLSASSTTSTALGYLDVSSSLTTLLAAKAPSASPTFTGTIGTPLTASKLLATDASGNLTATAANSSQATYLDFTSSGQTQLNAKLGLSNYSAKGDLVAGVSSGVVAGVTVGSNGKVLVADSGATAGLRWDNATPKKNYVTNWNAEGGVSTGWSTYADAAGTQPVDCTGGSPNSTWAASASSAIHDSNNFLATLNTGATRQGEGVSYAFTTDSGDSPAMMSIRFYYKVAGGTFAAGNDADRTSTGDSDFTVWIYDVTNGTLIQPFTYRLYSNSTTVAEPFVSNFQTNSNSTSYRLCIHKGTSTSVSGTAITVRFDDFEISRSNIALNTPISDWVSYTPSATNFGNGTTTGYWRRVGDSMQLSIRGLVGSSAPTGTILFSLPSGYTFDSTKYVSTPNVGNAIGAGSSAQYTGSATTNGTNQFQIYQNAVSAPWNATNPVTWVSGNFITLDAQAPIQGWSSSTQVSDGWDARQIVFVGKNTASTSIATTGTYVPFTSQKDSTASWSTDTFTCPSAGDYEVKAGLHGSSTSNYFYAQVDKNGTLYARILQNESRGDRLASGSVIVYNCAAGDTIKLKAYSDTSSQTLNASADLNFITISKLSSPQTVSITEVVAARYTTAAGQSISNGATSIIDFATKDYDTHGAVTTGASWKFTAPIAGLYSVKALVRYANSLAWSSGSYVSALLYKNGSSFSTQDTLFQATVTPAQGPAASLSDSVWLNAGDYIDLRTSHGESSARALVAASTLVRITIERIK